MLKRASLLFAIAGLACAQAQPVANDKPIHVHADPAASAATAVDESKAPLLEGMGSFHWKITTSSALAQRMFDQGMVLAYAFNHAEAARAFRYGARLDPDCAMCWWGAALVAGPNINAKMEDSDAPKAWEALGKAQAAAAKASKTERQYIESIASRYAKDNPADRGALDAAYAKAICHLAGTLREDANAQTLCAEAEMDLHPWDYWDPASGKPRDWTPAILARLEAVLAKDSRHPGANHLYVHAIEASKHPQRALAAADRLVDLAPGAGHLVHMPSHIYIRVGRYHDASEANERAIKVDDSYVAQCREQGIYPLAYKPHNWHFLWAATTFEGRSRRALEAAQRLSDGVADEKMTCHGFGTLQHYKVTPLYAHVRFGMWDRILATPAPTDLPYRKAVWRYAQGMAHIFTNDLAAAQADLDELRKLAADAALDEVTIWDINTTRALVAIAVEVVAGELDAKRKQWPAAIAHLEKAVRLNLELNYNEPADWYYPVRHSLGAVYLDAKRAKDAERVYREDLADVPNNGYSLFGLAQALRAQGKSREAAEVDVKFKEAWRNADHTLASSRF